MYCSHCGQPLTDEPSLCPHCQAPLRPTAQQLPDTEAWYRAAIGPKSQEYYLQRFTQFDAAGKAGLSWHWPALFITFYWLLYRKLWGPALLYFLLPYLFLALSAVVASTSGWLTTLLDLGYLLLLLVAPPLYANALYYRHCQRLIAKVQARGTEPQQQLGELTGRGGTSHVAIILVMVLVGISLIGIVAAIAIPAYQTYTLRVQTEQVRQVGAAASHAVSRYYGANLTLPENLQQTGFTPAPSPYIQQLSLDPHSGEISIVLNGRVIQGQHLLFTPSRAAEGKLSWLCHSAEIKQNYLPPACRTAQSQAPH